MSMELSFKDVGGLVCEGTRTVTLRARSSSKAAERSWGDDPLTERTAMVAVFARNRETEMVEEERGVQGRRFLQVMLTDGKSSFSGSITADGVQSAGRNLLETAGIESYRFRSSCEKGSEPAADSEEDQKLALVRTILLSKTNYSVAYELVSEARQVELTIREKRSSGLLLKVWGGRLNLVSTPTNNTGDATNGQGRCESPLDSHSAFPFVLALGDSFQAALEKIRELRKEKERVLKEMLGWKETVDLLDAKWQLEKDELTDRFLVLYNSVKSDLRKARSDLEEERKKKEVVVRSLEHNALNSSSKALREEAVDHMDEHDYELYDEKEVARLAAGPPKSIDSRIMNVNRYSKSSTVAKVSDCRGRGDKPAANTSQATKPSEKSTSGFDESNAELIREDFSYQDDGINYSQEGTGIESQSSVLKNPHTGALEMWDPKSIFADSEDESVERQRTTMAESPLGHSFSKLKRPVEALGGTEQPSKKGKSRPVTNIAKAANAGRTFDSSSEGKQTQRFGVDGKSAPGDEGSESGDSTESVPLL